MPNIGVYVSEALMGRMARLKKEERPVSVSAICQAALDQAVSAAERGVFEARKHEIVQRLRVARTPEQRAEAAGNESGRSWAADVASWTDLQAVVAWGPISCEWVTEDGGRFGQWMIFVGGSPLPNLEGLPDPGQVLEPSYSEAHYQVAFWYGFQLGSKSIWALVHDEMSAEDDTDPDDIPF